MGVGIRSERGLHDGGGFREQRRFGRPLHYKHGPAEDRLGELTPFGLEGLGLECAQVDRGTPQRTVRLAVQNHDIPGLELLDYIG